MCNFVCCWLQVKGVTSFLLGPSFIEVIQLAVHSQERVARLVIDAENSVPTCALRCEPCACMVNFTFGAHSFCRS